MSVIYLLQGRHEVTFGLSEHLPLVGCDVDVIE
jgi:hypothetical protein